MRRRTYSLDGEHSMLLDNSPLTWNRNFIPNIERSLRVTAYQSPEGRADVLLLLRRTAWLSREAVGRRASTSVGSQPPCRAASRLCRIAVFVASWRLVAARCFTRSVSRTSPSAPCPRYAGRAGGRKPASRARPRRCGPANAKQSGCPHPIQCTASRIDAASHGA